MDSFLALPAAEQKLYFEQAEGKLGLPAATIEKDFWVCWTLKMLFDLPDWGSRLTFKGGTSLSKGWHLIKRFSEDVDIVIDRAALGFGGEDAPDRAPSNKQVRKRLDALRAASRECVNQRLLPALAAAISREMPEGLAWQLLPDADDPDGQSLLLLYPTGFAESLSYLSQVVRIELGARSDTEPTLEARISPYLHTAFPELLPRGIFSVRTVSPERTFWEKAMLLHEETFRPPHKKRKARMARHYYDVYCLIKADIGRRAADSPGLFERIATHREVYFRYTWVDYSTLRPGCLSLVPTDEQLAAWRSDYDTMRSEMFFGEPPEFDEVIQTVRAFEDEVNAGADR